MSEGPFKLYNSGHLNFWNGTFDFASDTVTCVLLSSSYSPSSGDSTWNDIKSYEVSDGDYSSQKISNASVTNSGSTVTVDCDSIGFGSNVSIEAKYAVLVQQSGASLANDDNLIGYADLDTTSETATAKSHNSEF